MNITDDDDWDNWLKRWKHLSDDEDSEFCSCKIPDVHDLSLFRPYFVCNSCNKTIDEKKLDRK